MSRAPSPRVTIALCTRNGAEHLAEQLASYVAQSHTAWDLWVSDDGSVDATLDIIADFAATHGREHTIRVIEGPRTGVAMNFLSLLCHPDLPAQPVSLSDQDDVWKPEKLALGLEHMGGIEPRLYGAQSIHTDENLVPIGTSLGGGTPSFGNALVQNIVSGHSAMINIAALDLIRRSGIPLDTPYHDWWLYQLVSGAGGTVIVRPEQVLFYRQHHRNTLGSNRGLQAQASRGFKVFGRTYGNWITANTRALGAVAPLLTAEARATLGALEAHPVRWGLARAHAFAQHGVRRQRRLETALLYAAVALGCV